MVKKDFAENSDFKFRAKAFVIFSIIFILFLSADILIDFYLSGNINNIFYYTEILGALLIIVNLVAFLLFKDERNITIFLIIAGFLSFLFAICKEGSLDSVAGLIAYPFIVAFTRGYKSVVPWNLPVIFGFISVFLFKEDLFKFLNLNNIPGVKSEKILLELMFGYLIVVLVSYFLSKTAKDITFEIYNISVKDPLTGLFNRAFALSYLEQETEELRRNRNLKNNICIVYIDLDNFKTVNDTFGHSVGDSVLTKVASIFKSFFRKSDVVARLGGDEFLVIAKNVECESLNRRLEDLRNKVERELKRFGISMSYGISEIPKDSTTAKEALEIADTRMYENKQLRKGKAVRRELPSAEEPTS